MGNAADPSRLLTQRILNFIHSLYLGEEAALTVMEVLSSSDGHAADPRVITKRRSEEVRAQVVRWYQGCFRGESLFQVGWKSAEGFDAQRALSYLDYPMSRMPGAIADLAAFPQGDPSGVSWDEARSALAAIVRALSFDLYFCKGQMDLCELAGRAEEISQVAVFEEEYQRRLLWCKQQMEAARDTQTITPIGEVFARFGEYAECALRSQLHEAAMIRARFGGPSAALTLLFTPDELQGWQAAGFDPAGAGAWRAFKFDPALAQEWTQNGFAIPGGAWAWSIAGFSPSEAKEWSQLKISPQQANSWREAGLSSIDAGAFMRRGITSPDQLPRGE